MNPIPAALNAPAPLPAAQPVFAIVYDLHKPSDEAGGISSLLPAGHFHANHGSAWYYRQLVNRLVALGYQQGEYSFYSRQTTLAQATIDACNLQTHPTLTWMAVPGVVRRMHVVNLTHVGSLY